MCSVVGLIAAAALGGTPVSAQGRLLVQAGSATSLPAPDAASDAALYGVGGLALEWVGDRTLALASVYGGVAADEVHGADFGSAVVDVEGWWAGGTAVGLVAGASGFRIGDPFTYRTAALRGGPALRIVTGPVTTRLEAEVGSGSTRVEVRGPRGGVRRAARTLWSRGLDLDIGLSGSRWRVGAAAGAWQSDGGDFRRMGASTSWAGRRWSAHLETGVWRTPLGTEWTGGLSLSIPLGSATTASATVGRAAPDALTLVEAGTQAGALLGWSLLSFGGPPPPLTTVTRSDEGITVGFRLAESALDDATTVALIGDFTGWTPTPMHRDDDVWTLDLPVEPGLYHYGFEVDGEWYVPDDLPGNVPDDWGRTNATLVVNDDEGGLR